MNLQACFSSAIEASGKLDWQNSTVTQKLAEELKQSHAELIQAATGEEIEQCQNFSENGPFDWNRMAKQLLFWLQNNDEGYLGWLKKGELPKELYPCDVSIDLSEVDNWDPETGFSTNGEKDIGPANGPLCLTEFEKMAYATTITLLGVTGDEHPPPSRTYSLENPYLHTMFL